MKETHRCQYFTLHRSESNFPGVPQDIFVGKYWEAILKENEYLHLSRLLSFAQAGSEDAASVDNNRIQRTPVCLDISKDQFTQWFP